MKPLEIALGIVLLVLSVVIVALVMGQSSKDKRSGVISGVADTFFNKGKAGRLDKVLNMVTVAVTAVFFVLIVVMYCIA